MLPQDLISTSKVKVYGQYFLISLLNFSYNIFYKNPQRVFSKKKNKFGNLCGFEAQPNIVSSQASPGLKFDKDVKQRGPGAGRRVTQLRIELKGLQWEGTEKQDNTARNIQ